MRTMDLNCDMGESFGRYSLGADASLMPLVTSAAIACGMHGGDPLVMQHTVALAVKHGVAIGAHPGYPDLQGFGRRAMDLTPAEVEALVLYQIGALAAFTRAAGVELTHVKPHGALYNQAAASLELAQAVARAVKSFSRELILVGLAGSALPEAGLDAGLQVASEGFPERAYNPDGTLMSRRLPGAVIESPVEAAEQALRLAAEGIAIRVGGETRRLPVDTLCVHGDNPNAVAIVSAIRAALEGQGIRLSGL